MRSIVATRPLQWLVAGLAGLCAASAWGQAAAPPPKSEVAKRIESALASEIRTPEERARDATERKPVQTLEFFGLQPNMRVVELLPGAGWYTKVLAPVLADEGQLIVAIGTTRLAPRLKEWKLDKVQVAEFKGELKPTGTFGIFGAAELDIPLEDVDMVLTFRNCTT